ncbi:hypothetical protein GCM10010434_088750 [Winogradskya humida]
MREQQGAAAEGQEAQPAAGQRVTTAAARPETVVRRERVTQPIPFDTTTVGDPSRSRGSKRVQAEGTPGERVLNYLVTLIGNRETNRRLIGSTVTRPPRHRVIAVGNRPASPNAASPNAASPNAASPNAASPNAASPNAASPNARPDFARPGAGQNDTARPGAGQNDTARPGAGQNDTARPGAGQNDVARPGASQNDASGQNNASHPNAARPNAAQPNAARPNAAQPNAARPSADRNDADRNDADRDKDDRRRSDERRSAVCADASKSQEERDLDLISDANLDAKQLTTRCDKQ